MLEGPRHPAIQAEVHRQVQATRVRLGLSAVVLLAMCWGLLFPEIVVAWIQKLLVDHLPTLLQLVD